MQLRCTRSPMNRNVMSLRWVVGEIAVIGVFFAWARWESRHGRLFLWPNHWSREDLAHFVLHSRIAWSCILLSAYGLARRWGPTLHQRSFRAGAWVMLVVALTATSWTMWGHDRVFWGDWSDLDPSGAITPDRTIFALAAWYDLQYPVTTPHTFKIHGEMPRVQHWFGQHVVLLVLLDGLLLGVLLRRIGAREAEESFEPCWDS